MNIAVYSLLIFGGSVLSANEVTTWSEIAGRASFASGLGALDFRVTHFCNHPRRPFMMR